MRRRHSRSQSSTAARLTTTPRVRACASCAVCDGMMLASEPDVDLWRWRRAAPVRRIDHIVLSMLIGAGLLLVVRFADWWFRPSHVDRLPLFVLLTLALWYGI